MNLIKQHIPNFCSGFEPEVVPFETMEDLLSIPFVKRFTEDHKFEHFAFSETLMPNYPASLMAISDNGYHWWVVGKVMNPAELDIPIWDGGKYRIVNEACEIEIITKDNSYGCQRYKHYER